MGCNLSMDERMTILTIPVDLPLSMDSSVPETVSMIRLARRSGKTGGIVCLMKQTRQILRRSSDWV